MRGNLPATLPVLGFVMASRRPESLSIQAVQHTAAHSILNKSLAVGNHRHALCQGENHSRRKRTVHGDPYSVGPYRPAALE